MCCRFNDIEPQSAGLAKPDLHIEMNPDGLLHENVFIL